MREEELWGELIARIDVKTSDGWILWIKTLEGWVYHVTGDGDVGRLNYSSLPGCRKAIFNFIMHGKKPKLAKLDPREAEIVAKEVGRRISPALTLVVAP